MVVVVYIFLGNNLKHQHSCLRQEHFFKIGQVSDLPSTSKETKNVFYTISLYQQTLSILTGGKVE